MFSSPVGDLPVGALARAPFTHDSSQTLKQHSHYWLIGQSSPTDLPRQRPIVEGYECHFQLSIASAILMRELPPFLLWRARQKKPDYDHRLPDQ